MSNISLKIKMDSNNFQLTGNTNNIKPRQDITFEDVISFDALYNAAKECMKGVGWKSSVQMFKIDLLQWVSTIRKDLIEGTYKSRGFIEFTICERGKTRNIQSVHISERMVQKSLCQNALRPIIIPRLIYDNSASIPGKGTSFALHRLKHHLQDHYKEYGQNGYILIGDFSNYFGSIRHDILIQKLRQVIFDDAIFELTKYFIDCFSGEIGLGLGSEISQICAMFYLNDIDHFIKEKLFIKGYGRYNDDFYLIDNDIEYLKCCLNNISFHIDNLGLRLNPKTKIIKLDQSFSYLKKNIYLTDTGKVTMRVPQKSITKNRQLLKKYKHMLLDDEITYSSIDQSYRSRRGFLQEYNQYDSIKELDNLYNKLFIEDFISGKEKDDYDRRRNCKKL